MDVAFDLKRDARAVEPSPSPPMTARVLVPPSRIHDSRQSSASAAAMQDEEWAEAGAVERLSEQRSSTSTTATRSLSTRASGPLAARPLNAAPVLQRKRRSTSLLRVPAPTFPYESRASEPRSDLEGPARVDDNTAALPSASGRNLQDPKQHVQRTSGGSSGASAARRSSVIGPDPHDCIDLREGEVAVHGDDEEDEEPHEMQVVPLPHKFYQRPQQQQQQQRRPASTVTDDLAALVNADTVDRCRSDSHGRVFLVDDGELAGAAHQTHKRAFFSVGHASRHSMRSASIRAPTELAEDEEVEEARCTEAAGSAAAATASSSPSPSASPSDVNADAEFELEYFFYPTSTDADCADDEPLHANDETTPARTYSKNDGSGGDEECARGNGAAARRTSSTSPSSSLPRWAHSLTEETPFTPFAFTPQCPPAATPVAAADGRHGNVLKELVSSTQQRLTVQDVVAAVLAAPPPPPLPPAVRVREVLPDREEAVGGDGPLDEPPPRRPAEDARFSAHPSTSPQQHDNTETERLPQRVENVRARLSHVDQVMSRFDAVIEARQAELKTVEARRYELTQQTESHKARAAMARKETRRLRDRQHTKEELQLLRDMLLDKENRLSVAQSHLLALKRLRQQLELLHTASTGKSSHQKSSTSERRVASASTLTENATQEETSEGHSLPVVAPATKRSAPVLPLSPPHVEVRGAAQSLLAPSPTTTAALQTAATSATTATDVAASSEEGVAEVATREEEEKSPRSVSAASCTSSSASSLASLDTCDIMDDFLEELLMEVDGLAKVCIQLPSPPPAAMSYCNRATRPAGLGGMSGHSNGNGAPRRARSTYSALNRRLNEGNNGFFSFFGGATEAHLNSKPMSTFLANLDRLAVSSWELEEEVQLRARELATDQEEEELRARLMVEYGLVNKPDAADRGSDEGCGTVGPLLSPVTPLQPSRTEEVVEALLLSEDVDPLAATASSDRTTRQLFLSSPEHGRRSRGSVGAASNGAVLSPPGAPVASPLLRRPVSATSLLPTLVYAYPRVAAVSQHLDDEQQQIQKHYANTIATARQQRRELTSKLQEVFRLHVAPALQQRIDVLRQQQTSLARQLADLGVKEVTLVWEEEEPVALDDAALRQLMDEATAAGRRRWLAGTRRRNGGAGQRSRSRISAHSATREEDSGYGDDASSNRGLSLPQGEGELFRQRDTSPGHLINPVRHVYRRTLHVVCETPAEEGGEAAAMRCATPASPRSGRRSGVSQPPQQHQQRHHHHHHRRERGGLEDGAASGRVHSARSARRRASVGSGRRSSTAAASFSQQPPSQAQRNASIASAAINKTCAALQLYTYAPSQQLLQMARCRSDARGEPGAGVAEVTTESRVHGKTSANAKPSRFALIGTSSQRCSGGTPRVSGAPGASATTRSSTTSGRVSAVVPPSPRRRTTSQPVSPRLPPGRIEGTRQHRHDAAPPNKAIASPVAPRVEDTRVRLPEDVGTPQCGAAATPIASAGLWSPFAHIRDALADGAVHVALTFGGAEAHRRQVAHARREAYQREFWRLREELARVDEDIFQLRTRHTDLCALQQQAEEEQQRKLAEAEAKVKKCRAFYKTLKRENKEWQDICDELQRVLREGE